MADLPHISFQPVGSAPPAIYCNAVQMLFSPWDFTVELSHLSPEATLQPTSTEPGAAPTEAAISSVSVQKHVVSTVVMSPLHAKAMLKVLAEHIERYEGSSGKSPTSTLSSLAERERRHDNVLHGCQRHHVS